MTLSRCFVHFLAVIFLTFANGELEKALSCSHSQLFCRQSRKCVELSLVCSGLINCNNSNTSNELICSGREENKLRTVTPVCPEKWIGPRNGFCYFFQPDLKKSWFDAQQKCRTLHPYGQLMSLIVLASTFTRTVQRRLTSLIWFANSERDEPMRLSVSHGKFITRKNSRCAAGFIRRRSSLFSQIISVRKNCNTRFNFICQLSFPEVKLARSGNRISLVSAGGKRRQSFEQQKSRLTFESIKKERAHLMELSSKSNVKRGVPFLSNNPQNSSVLQISQSASSILSRNSFLSDKTSTLNVQKIGFWDQKDAKVGGFPSNPILKVMATRKPDNFKGMVRSKNLAVTFQRDRSNGLEISSKRNHEPVVNINPLPPLRLSMVLLPSMTKTWSRDRFRSTELMDDNLGSKKDFSNSLPITYSISNSSSIHTWVFVSTSMTTTCQSGFTTRLFTLSFTPSFVIKPTPSRVSAVSITNASVFTESSTKAPGRTTTKKPTGFFQSKTTVIGVSAGGGKILCTIPMD